MALPQIVQTDDEIGFHWATPDGKPAWLSVLIPDDDEPDRLLGTHLSAMDDVMIGAAGELGEVLGGGRAPDDEERRNLRDLYRALDRLAHEYAAAVAVAELPVDLRGGQIIGTSVLMSIGARQQLGLLGPAPLENSLDDPPDGVIGGFGRFETVDEDKPWLGGRWVVVTQDDKRLPASLSLLMFESSGVNKDGALIEHREALVKVVETMNEPGADTLGAVCAIDWLLFDWLMAHRDGPDSAAVEVPGGVTDAAMIVTAADASAVARAAIDPGLLDLPR
jgi:hypothetical protein